jgi:hypothetical protein
MIFPKFGRKYLIRKYLVVKKICHIHRPLTQYLRSEFWMRMPKRHTPRFNPQLPGLPELRMCGYSVLLAGMALRHLFVSNRVAPD